MAERKSLSKKTRFEVFKRDSFTCQYCGSKAPSVVLEVDHIKPVKEGGSNDLMNLITSCFECNRGKGAKKISDDSIVEKQRRQIEELNIRRQQLEMMLEWRDQIKSLEETESSKAVDYWNEKSSLSGSVLNKYGEGIIISHVKKYGIINVLNAIDIASEKYGIDSSEEFDIALKKLGGILYLQNAPDHKKKISYIKGICRNKFHYFNEKRASISLNEFYKNGCDLDHLQEMLISNDLKNWSQFINYIEED